eukprot:scaffold10941_cov81-Phaeocystis_antarctica.AAC.1
MYTPRLSRPSSSCAPLHVGQELTWDYGANHGAAAVPVTWACCVHLCPTYNLRVRGRHAPTGTRNPAA